MSNWKVVVPESTENLVLNPSFETTGNYTALGAATATRYGLYARYGLYSINILTGADNDGVSLTLETLDNEIHYVTLHITRGTLPDSWDVSLDDTNYHEMTKLEDLDDGCALYGVEIPAAQANGSTTLYIRQNGAGSGDFYIDGVQVEETQRTTYCDGDQEDCEWKGEAHASKSTRPDTTRAGGLIEDLVTDYAFYEYDMIGTGMAPTRVSIREFATLPGGSLSSISTPARRFTLAGYLKETTMADLHATRQALEELLDADAVPRTREEKAQPVRLRYYGSDIIKEIEAHYAGGLEAMLQSKNWTLEKIPLQFACEDPFWYQIGNSAQALDHYDSDTLRYCAGRLRENGQWGTGQWSDLGLSSNPTAGGTIYAIAVSPVDGKIYFGGSFTGWGGVAGRDYIAAYDPADGTWETVGSASDLNGTVRALCFSPDGTLYAGGEFTAAGGDTAADYFASWDGSSWSHLGDPDSGGASITRVNAIAIAQNGDIYAGGTWDDWAGVADADNIAIYDVSASSWIAGPGPCPDNIYALAADQNGNVYIGGDYTNWGDANGDALVVYDGSSLSSLSTGISGTTPTVYAIAIATDGRVFAGGAFNAAGGVTAHSIAVWNGTAFEEVGTGVWETGGTSYSVYDIAIAPDGIVYICGSFLEAGQIEVVDRIAGWNGTSYFHLDVDLPGSPTPQAIAIGAVDPVIERNYEMYVGFNTTGTAYYAGNQTVSNDGNAPAYPVIYVKSDASSLGPSGRLLWMKNERTGMTLYFDYQPLKGETLKIDLRPTEQTITSSYFGKRMSAILKNSDFGEFRFLPGDNVITTFLDESGGSSFTVWAEWRDAYKGQD